ncbi:MAG: ubiquitin-like domain-containing protein [Myxococcales bacterium]
MPEQFQIIIVHGVNKKLEVKETELIGDVKVRAMSLFDIPATEKDKYVLRAKDVTLKDNETVAQAKLHPEEKVTLASAAPFGCGLVSHVVA